MQKNVLISVVFFSFLGAVPAQEINIEVQVIIDDGQEKHPGSVYLHNPRLEITRFTDNEGKAEMPVILGDLLYITSDFYEDRSFLITEKVIEKRKLTLHLNLKPIVLNEAVIQPWLLSGNLASDAKRAGFEDLPSVVYANLGIKEKAVPKPNPAGYNPGKFTPADVLTFKFEKIIGEITGFNSKQRRLHAWEEREKKIERLREKWGDAYFSEELDLPFHKIREFIFFVIETTNITELTAQNKFTEAEALLAEKSREYLSRSESLISSE